MFTLMDTDKDGRVTYEELKTGLQKVGSQLAEPEVKMLMEVVSSVVISFLALCFSRMLIPLSVPLWLLPFGKISSSSCSKHHVFIPLY